MQGHIVQVALGVFGVLSVAILLLAVFNDNGALAAHRQRVKLEKMEAENAKIAKEIEDLTHEIQSLKTDPAYIEKILREEYGFVGADEFIIQTPKN